MKKSILIAAVAMSMSVFGADYASMSTEELMSLQRTMPASEREAFRAEVQKRVAAMTPEEKAKYNLGRNLGGKGKGQGRGQGKRLKDGTGQGQGKGNRGGGQ